HCRLHHRYRDAEPRLHAHRPPRHAARRAASAGLRPGLRRRRARDGAGSRCRARPSRGARAAPGDRALRPLLPQERCLQEQHRRHRLVRRRRRGGDHLVRRRRAGAGRRRRAYLAGYTRRHGLGRRRRWAQGRLLPGYSGAGARPDARGDDRLPRPPRPLAGGYRPFHLPSRRRQGHRRARSGVRACRGHARRRAQRVARFRQHVGGDRALRARARAAPRAQRPAADDGARPGLQQRLSTHRDGGVSAPAFLIAVVAVARLAELVYATRNTRALLAQGGVEIGRNHYVMIVLLHALWLASLWIFVPADAAISWPWLAVFVILQGLRVWVIASLGRFWTTRIVTLPGAPLVRRGPYRFVRHPNYLVVAGEILVLPLVFGAWRIALVFTLLNLAILAWRIRVEEQALAPRRAVHGTGS